MKSDGEPTYLLPDIAYHRDKFARGFELLIDIWGADHHGYVSRLRPACRPSATTPDDLEIILGQLVHARARRRGGADVEARRRHRRCSTTCVDEVGPDAARLTFLLQSLDTRQTFDLDLDRQRSRTRTRSSTCSTPTPASTPSAAVAAERGVERPPLDEVDLVAARPRARARRAAHAVRAARRGRARRAPTGRPHKVTTWVRELAGRVPRLLPRLLRDRRGVAAELTQARLWLVEAARIGLAIGLDLLGVSAPESM